MSTCQHEYMSTRVHVLVHVGIPRCRSKARGTMLGHVIKIWTEQVRITTSMGTEEVRITTSMGTEEVSMGTQEVRIITTITVSNSWGFHTIMVKALLPHDVTKCTSSGILRSRVHWTRDSGLVPTPDRCFTPYRHATTTEYLVQPTSTYLL
jgi:hypothetical protein